GKVEARLLGSRSEGGTGARAGGNTCAPLSAHVGSLVGNRTLSRHRRMTESDPGCVKTHTIAKCRKYNSPTRYRTSCAEHDSTPWCANFFEMFLRARRAHFRHQPPEHETRSCDGMPGALASVSKGPHCQMFSSAFPKLAETVGGKITQDAPWGVFWGVMLGAWRVDRSSSRLAVGKRRLLGAVAFGALPLLGGLTSLGPAWGQVSETLPEVT